MEEAIRRQITTLTTERDAIVDEGNRREAEFQALLRQHQEWMQTRQRRVYELTGGIQALTRVLPQLEGTRNEQAS